jgi:hypothetical protein
LIRAQNRFQSLFFGANRIQERSWSAGRGLVLEASLIDLPGRCIGGALRQRKVWENFKHSIAKYFSFPPKYVVGRPLRFLSPISSKYSFGSYPAIFLSHRSRPSNLKFGLFVRVPNLTPKAGATSRRKAACALIPCTSSSQHLSPSRGRKRLPISGP